MLWFTIGGSRSLSNLVVFAGNSRQTGGEPCGDREKYSVCLAFLNRADVWCL